MNIKDRRSAIKPGKTMAGLVYSRLLPALGAKIPTLNVSSGIGHAARGNLFAYEYDPRMFRGAGSDGKMETKRKKDERRTGMGRVI